MKSRRLFSLLLSALVIVSMGVAVVPMAPASAGPAPSGEAQGTNGETLGYDPDTGRLIFIGAPAGSAIASPAGDLSALSTEEQADTFVTAYAPAFGLSDPSQELVAQTSDDGDQVTRYQQTYEGIPVFGGNLVVNTSDDGGLVAMAGKVSADLDVNVTPSISADSAADTAFGLVAKVYDAERDQIKVGTPALWIYDEKMFTESVFGPQLVWKVDVTVEGAPIHEVVMVNAQYGKVSQHYNQTDTSWALNGKLGKRTPSQPQVSALAGGDPQWSVYTDHNQAGNLPGDFICDQDSPSCGSDPQALDARDFTLDTYDFYWDVLERDSINAAGMPIISTIHYGNPSTAAKWFKNAYWDGDQMVYGDRVAVDDVVAHELTHGVTDYESGLIYLYQSGAINESLSDVFGELVDLSNVDDYYVNDTTGRWLLGESVEGPTKAFRNMKNPPAFGDPDKMTSALYYKGADDNGGVHTNSGVNNKAASLMTDGGTFNGYTVTGIGITKVAKIYYKAQTEGYLFPGADYLDLYYALKGACTELVGLGDVTLGDCDQVEKATKAVEMHIKPAALTGPLVEACPVGSVESDTLFSDDFEDDTFTTDNWDFTGSGTDIQFDLDTGDRIDIIPVDLIPPTWSTSEYTDAIGQGSALWGGGPTELNNFVDWVYDPYYDDYFPDFELEYASEEAALAASVPIPNDGQTYLTFDHMYKFESDGPTGNYDGGILEYSVDDGANWVDAKLLYNFGSKYNGTIVNYRSDAVYQPLSAKQAYVANSLNGVLGARYNLSSLAGQDVKLRFRAGYDVSTDWGWFIDNVDVHTCLAIPSIPLLSAPVDKSLITNYTPTLVWSTSSPDLDHYQIQINTDPAFGIGTMFYDDSTGTASTYTTDPLAPNTTYYWRVKSFNSLGGTSGWSLARSFRTVIATPLLNSPLFTPPVPPDPAVPTQLDNKRPTLVWLPVSGAASYTVEAALSTSVFGKKTSAIIATVTGTSYTPAADLLGGKDYQWRVIANVAKGGNGPSAYSDVWQFHTANPPSVPVLVSPAIGALVTDYTPDLNWNASTPDLSYYQLQVADNSGFATPVINITAPGEIVSLTYTPIANLTPNKTYYWRVRAANVSNHFSGWSLARSFRTVIATPLLNSPLFTPPVPPDPAVPTQLDNKRPTLVWLPVSGAASYTVEAALSTSVFGKKTSAIIATVTGTSYTPAADLLGGKDYQWRVIANVAKGGNGPSAYSDVWQFHTANPPSVPVLVSPAIGALVTDYTPDLNWNASTPDLSYYQLQVADNSGFATPVINITAPGEIVSLTYTPIANLTPNKTYYWRVRAANVSNHFSGWSLARSFRTVIATPLLNSPLFTPPVPPDPAVPTQLDNKRPTLVWLPVSGAASYTVEAALSTSVFGKKTSAIIATVTGTSYTPAADLLGGKDYQWRVIANVAKGGNGPSAYSDVWQFHTANPPSVPVLVSPAIGALVTDYTPDLNWNASTPDLSYYQLQVADNSGFATPVINITAPGEIVSLTYTPIANLTPNKTYYWRVRAANVSNHFSAWSLARSFRTVIATPLLNSPLFTPPVPPDPAVPTQLDNKRPTLVWLPVAGAASYTVEAALSTSVFGKKTSAIIATVTGTSYTPAADLLGGKDYQWRVIANVAKGGNGPSAYSDVWQFHTANPPSVPVLVSPAIGALVTDYTPDLNWNASTPDLSYYQLQVADNSGFATPVINITAPGEIVSLTYTPIANLTPNKTYYWRVRAANVSNHFSAWSLARSFRTVIATPLLNSPLFTPPVPPDPAVPTQLDNKRPTLVWLPVSGAASYTVEAALSTSVFGKKTSAIIATVTGTSYTPAADLLGGKDYQWRVIANVAKGGNGPSAYSDVWQFHTANPPSVPVLVSPAIGALVTDYTPDLNWNASTPDLSYYQLQVADNSGFATPVINITAPGEIVSLTYTPIANLTPNKTYYWRVRAANVSNHFSGWSLARSFRTALDTPNLLDPEDDDVTTTYRPILDWDAVSGAISYTIQISKVPDFTTTVVNVTPVGTETTYAPLANLPKGPLFWRVMANGVKGGNGPSAWSTGSFSIVNLSAGGVDSDGDGLPDDWEINGYDADGDGTLDVDLPALGALWNHKDIFVEMDFMANDCGGTTFVNGLAPNATVIAAIEDVFANAPVNNPDLTQGINIHLELGNQVACDEDLAPADTDFYALKADNFDPARAAVYHYMIWAVGYNSGTSSGLSFGLPATDFIVTLGSWGTTATDGTDEQKIGTFIHELGHNLNLTHGGTDHNNYKPNYLSVMNYFFQFSGLYRNGWGNSTTNRLNFDYQRIATPALNENSLNETVTIGSLAAGYANKHFCPDFGSPYGGGWWGDDWDYPTINVTYLGRVDWNCDGDYNDVGVKADVNGDDYLSSLTSQNNWASIVYNGGGIIGSGASPQVLLSVARNTPIVEWNELTLEMQQEMINRKLVP